MHGVCACVSVLGTEGLGLTGACRGRGIMGIGKKRHQSNWTLGFDLWTGILGYRERRAEAVGPQRDGYQAAGLKRKPKTRAPS